MTRTAKHHAIPALVDVKQGLVGRELFVNEELYQQEQEQLFAHCWLFVGHESQIPKPGDYFVSGMGEESVLLTRDREQRIHVFLNTCRHRGMKVLHPCRMRGARQPAVGRDGAGRRRIRDPRAWRGLGRARECQFRSRDAKQSPARAIIVAESASYTDGRRLA